jgi:hypothetical protein
MSRPIEAESRPRLTQERNQKKLAMYRMSQGQVPGVEEQAPGQKQEESERANRISSLRLSWAEGSLHLHVPSQVFAVNDLQHPFLVDTFRGNTTSIAVGDASSGVYSGVSTGLGSGDVSSSDTEPDSEAEVDVENMVGEWMEVRIPGRPDQTYLAKLQSFDKVRSDMNSPRDFCPSIVESPAPPPPEYQAS